MCDRNTDVQMKTTVALWLLIIGNGSSLQIPTARRWKNDLVRGYQQRVAADPIFPKKSVIEVLLAAATQLSAEWNRRGTPQMIPQLDFVVAGVLTAMAGKYYSMWRVAPTLDGDVETNPKDDGTVTSEVPTNAFQETLLDGVTRPTLSQRILSLFAPMPSLFQAGVIASAAGYGVVAFLIQLRAVVMPSYQAATQNVNVAYASIYTGLFMATVSNIRYQLLQGIIEPKIIDKTRPWPLVHALFTAVVRLLNGFLGSLLAIMGMRRLGLQKLK